MINLKPIPSSNLHDYQWRAIEYALKNKKCALFLGLGLGKTISSLTVAAIQLAISDTQRVLIVAPLRVANTVWKKEALSWQHTKNLNIVVATGDSPSRMQALNSDAEVYVINVDNLPWMIKMFPRNSWRWDMVIIDESSTFKNPSTIRSKSLRSICLNKTLKIKKVARRFPSPVKRMLLLSATPATNGLANLWAQIVLLDGGARLGRSFSAFIQRYFYTNPFAGRFSKPEILDGAADEIYEKINDICFVMRAEDYIELPPITYNNIEVHLPDKAISQYKQFQRDSIIELAEMNDAEIIATSSSAKSNKLLQFANGAVYTGDAPENPKAKREYAVIHNEKIDRLAELVEAAEGCENLIVAYYYKSDLDRLLKRFPQSVTMDKQGNCIEDFNSGKIPLLLIHPDSDSMGINLQSGASTLIFFSLMWNLESYQQLVGRVYRQGQKNPVTIHHITCANTIETQVVQALTSKAKTQQEFIDTLRVLLP